MSLNHHRCEPYRLFKKGYDTLEIANLLQRSEAEVLRDINMVRSALRDLPYPYHPHFQPGPLALPKSMYREAAE